METAPKAGTDQMTAFGRDVLEGLTQTPKQLHSKYFYDEAGDKLFQQIMQMPEYYLTDCEFEILNTHKSALQKMIGTDRFDLVELGAGDGAKTKVLLRHFQEQELDFRYCPVDISEYILGELEASLKEELPQLNCAPMQGDYFEMLEELHYRSKARKVVLFLGANIGNLRPKRAKSFLNRIGGNLEKGDLLLLGCDLKKDPQVILNAYNDPAGITAAFNLNILTRMNRELGADFRIEQFKHWETYNPVSGATRSFLVSLQDQDVYVEGINRRIHFKAWEPIEVELSQKYSPEEIEALAVATGFHPVRHFFDKDRYFVDSLWSYEGQ